jgi:hypothetical protein
MGEGREIPTDLSRLNGDEMNAHETDRQLRLYIFHPCRDPRFQASVERWSGPVSRWDEPERELDERFGMNQGDLPD